MFYINSPLTLSSFDFDVINLFGIIAAIFSQFNIIKNNLVLYTDIFYLFSLFFNFNCYLYYKDFVTIFFIVALCGFISIGLGYIIWHSSCTAEIFIKIAANIGTRVIGLVSGLVATLSLGDRLNKGACYRVPWDTDSNKNKEFDQKEGNKDTTENNTEQKIKKITKQSKKKIEYVFD